MTSNDSNEDSKPLVVFDPEGDIILFVKNTIRLQVSSKVLSLASSSCRSMLAELREAGSKRRPKSSTQSIPLLQDNPNGMRGLCQILHFGEEYLDDVQWVQGNEKVDMLLQVVNTAAKYQCIRWVKDDADKGLNTPEVVSSHSRLVMKAARLLENQDMYRKASFQLVKRLRPDFKDRDLLLDVAVSEERFPLHLDAFSEYMRDALARKFHILANEAHLAVLQDEFQNAPALGAVKDQFELVFHLMKFFDGMHRDDVTLEENLERIKGSTAKVIDKQENYRKVFLDKIVKARTMALDIENNKHGLGLCIYCSLDGPMLHGFTLNECIKSHSKGNKRKEPPK